MAPLLPIGQLVIAQRLIDLVVTGLANHTALAVWPQALILVLMESLLSLLVITIGRIEFMANDATHEELRLSMSRRLLEKTAQLDVGMFDNPDFYNQLEYLERHVYWRPNRIYDSLFEFLSAVTTLLATIGLFLILPLWIVIALIIVALPTFWFQTRYGEAVHTLDDEFAEQHRYGSYYSDVLTKRWAIKDIKLYNLSGTFLERFTRIWQNYIQIYWQTVRRFLSLQLTSGLIAVIVRGGIMAWLAWTTLLGRLTIGQFTLYGNLIGQLGAGISSLLRSLASIANQRPFIEKFAAFMMIEPAIREVAQPKRLSATKPLTIRFDNVSFRYPGQKTWALRAINLTIAPGEHLALVGENGAGKTTLVKLLARFYDPTEGQILVNDIDIRHYRLADLHQVIGIIFQDFSQFQAKVTENIGFGNIRQLAAERTIETAAATSGAHEFIKDLPEKYQTMLGREFAGGVELSGGQWQKIALARTFFRNARLLILDEPTAALDPAAEEHFYRQFLRLKKNVSAILISHRFSTVRMADQIIVLENGRLKEAGSHPELIKKNGRYAKLFRLQAARYQ